MSTHVALLRAINVGGRNIIPMADLRTLFAELGFAHATTLLNSGNVVFDGGRRTGAALERLLEAATARRFGVGADCVVRTAREWTELIAGNPCREEAKRDPGHLVVVVLKESPGPGCVDALRSAIRGPETVHAGDRRLYAVYPAGTGRSKLTLPLIEKTLGTRGTGRNWNTVVKLGELLKG